MGSRIGQGKIREGGPCGGEAVLIGAKGFGRGKGRGAWPWRFGCLGGHP